MKYKKWTLEQKLEILASSEAIGVVETCRNYNVSTGTFYSWKKKYENTTIDTFGFSIKLSGDGSVLAVGAPNADLNGSNRGTLRIYENIAGTWTQKGADINGVNANDSLGAAISLSADGSIVAVGAEYFAGNGSGSRTGHVRIFEYTGSTWTQIGNDIIGQNSLDYSGSSVDLSADGSIVAIGAHGNDANGSNSGHVRMFENSSGTWTQIGNSINGEFGGNRLGEKDTVSLSDDGTVVAVSSYRNSGEAGHARVFKNINGTWTQVGSDIDGEATPDQSGKTVAISGNGAVLAVGAPLNDGNGQNSGHVRVFTEASLGLEDHLEINNIDIYPNPTQNQLHINTTASIEKIEIYNSLGQKVVTTQETTIATRALQNGIYILKLYTEDGSVSVKRFIKE